jgi:hypothetical protein
MADIIVPKKRAVQIRAEGTRVLVVSDGRAILDLPWQAALSIARGLVAVARKAEEIAKAEQIVMDQAILTRAGAPFGLSNNPDIKKEAGKEAAWNTDLRRSMPGGVKSQEVFGTPTLKKEPPKESK